MSKWWDRSWNPVVGCTPISPGCLNCWARGLHNSRHKAYLAGKKMPKQYAKPFSEIQFFADRLEQITPRQAPKDIFVCDMGDLFHKDVPFEFIDKAMLTINKCRQHTFQILTKRADRMLEYITQKMTICVAKEMPLPNLWLGVTIENQEMADKRIPLLLQTPAAKRFLSVEPMLGGIDIEVAFEPWGCIDCAHMGTKDDFDVLGADAGRCFCNKCGHEIPMNPIDKSIDWVIVGCESGAYRRPCKISWIYSIVEQCQAAGVPVFVKQLDINGKVEKDITKFPKQLQIRNKP